VTVVAVVNPTTLLGKEVREVLERRPKLWDEMRLLSRDEEEIGTLTEIRGAAAMVAAAAPGDLDGADLVFLCGDRRASLPFLAELPAGAVAVLLAADAAPEDGPPVVAGVNLDEALPGAAAGVFVSPHPGAVLLSLLLRPLAAHGLAEAVATLLQPTSMYGEAGLDELYAQARRVIAIAAQEPAQVLPGQLAFNAFPSQLPGEHLAATVAALVGGSAPVAVEVCQGAIFHSFAASLFVRLRDDPDPLELRRALGRQPHLKLARAGKPLGPVEAAASPEVLVGPVRREGAAAAGAGGAPGYWIWGVMDNLTRGGALNAVAIAERALGATTP
jgi:aspartate-semialdehyde dehydrogenase